jgi:hypothetical protein
VLKRSILAAALAVGVLASPAFAASGLHGRGPDTQAAMLGLVTPTASTSGHSVQVLNQLCENPTHERRCSPIKPRLQVALEAAISQRITWVSHRDPHGDQFWVFAPVGFGSDPVDAQFAWRDPGKYGCYGWTELDFKRQHGTWQPYRGVGVVGCSASP